MSDTRLPSSQETPSTLDGLKVHRLDNGSPFEILPEHDMIHHAANDYADNGYVAEAQDLSAPTVAPVYATVSDVLEDAPADAPEVVREEDAPEYTNASTHAPNHAPIPTERSTAHSPTSTPMAAPAIAHAVNSSAQVANPAIHRASAAPVVAALPEDSPMDAPQNTVTFTPPAKRITAYESASTAQSAAMSAGGADPSWAGNEAKSAHPFGHRVVLIGVGGGGCNAIDHIAARTTGGLTLIKTDANQYSLAETHSDVVAIKLGDVDGAGGDPEKGKKWAEAQEERFREQLQDAQLVVVISALGGGTGSGATPVILELVQKMNILSIALLNLPFDFEGDRLAEAQAIVDDMRHNHLADGLTIMPNDLLLSDAEDEDEADMVDAYNRSREEMFSIIQCLQNLLDQSAEIKIDFSDIQRALRHRGLCHFKIVACEGHGIERLKQAFRWAVTNTLSEDSEVESAGGLIVNLRMNRSPKLGERKWLGDEIKQLVQGDGRFTKSNEVIDPTMNDNTLVVSVMATNINVGETIMVRESTMMDAAPAAPVAAKVVQIDAADAQNAKPAKRKPAKKASTDESVASDTAKFELGQSEQTENLIKTRKLNLNKPSDLSGTAFGRKQIS